jgi:hypothetical protein
VRDLLWLVVTFADLVQLVGERKADPSHYGAKGARVRDDLVSKFGRKVELGASNVVRTP